MYSLFYWWVMSLCGVGHRLDLDASPGVLGKLVRIAFGVTV